MWVEIAEGAIGGGYDGCNHWGVVERDGARMIVSDAQACPLRADMRAYQALARASTGKVRIFMAGSTLVMVARNYRLMARPGLPGPVPAS